MMLRFLRLKTAENTIKVRTQFWPFMLYGIKKQLSGLLTTELWCERRDTVLLRKSCILVDPMLRIRYPTSDFEDKNSPPDCFLNASHPLRVQVPHLLKNHIKKQLSSLLTTERWCERRDLNPYELPHTPLKRARLPIPPLSHINFVLSNACILYHFGKSLSIPFLIFFNVFWYSAV